jgi:long-subunit fatty acid transport protein
MPFLLHINNTCLGQQAGLGSWNILNVKYKIDEKWSVFGEAQIRSLKFYDDFHYHEYKAGVNYKVHPYATFTIAAGKYDTYKEGGNFIKPKNNAEFRLWPQITLAHAIGVLKVEQRYRAEFRYRLGVSYPFGKNEKGYLPFKISASNEIFFTDNEPYFGRNRALVSLGYKISKQASVQMGYLHQFDYKINDETVRDFIQTGLYIDL